MDDNQAVVFREWVLYDFSCIKVCNSIPGVDTLHNLFTRK